MRARLALQCAAIRCELREVVLRNKPAEMVGISTKATVPVLQLPSGEVIDESLDVMFWALTQADPHNWLNAEPEATRQLVQRNDSSFKTDLDHYKYHVRYPEHPQSHYRDRAQEFLAILETRLGQHGGIGLVDARITFADIAIFPFIRQFSRVDPDGFSNSRYTSVKQWLQGLEDSAGYQAVMKKYPPWSNGDAITFFAG
ncbi:MAG: glutathione S-transferase [Gammaproteobacteria bacterium]|jgi:glutathione S-transferase